MSSSNFTSFCQLYSDRLDKNEQYFVHSTQFAKDFAERIKAAVGAPEKVIEIVEIDGVKRYREYVELLAVDQNWNTKFYNFNDFDKLFIDDNGYLLFKIGITLQSYKGTDRVMFEIPCGVRPITSKECYLFVFLPDEKEIHRHIKWNTEYSGAKINNVITHVLKVLEGAISKDPYSNGEPLPLTS